MLSQDFLSAQASFIFIVSSDVTQIRLRHLQLPGRVASDSRIRGPGLILGPATYFHFSIAEGQLSVTGESMCI